MTTMQALWQTSVVSIKKIQTAIAAALSIKVVHKIVACNSQNASCPVCLWAIVSCAGVVDLIIHRTERLYHRIVLCTRQACGCCRCSSCPALHQSLWPLRAWFRCRSGGRRFTLTEALKCAEAILCGDGPSRFESCQPCLLVIRKIKNCPKRIAFRLFEVPTINVVVSFTIAAVLSLVTSTTRYVCRTAELTTKVSLKASLCNVCIYPSTAISILGSELYITSAICSIDQAQVSVQHHLFASAGLRAAPEI
mmetsp:Transcript_53125/g.98261  ORF Transcript_53125/g.98261 Transcript_53125/m.98261 type:complete len:251 (+) Transcript_53125:875-1627(+)